MRLFMNIAAFYLKHNYDKVAKFGLLSISGIGFPDMMSQRG